MKRRIHTRTFILYLFLIFQMSTNFLMGWLLKDHMALITCYSLISLMSLYSIFFIQRKSLLLLPLNWAFSLMSFFYLNKLNLTYSMILVVYISILSLIWIFWRKYLKRVYYFHKDSIFNDSIKNNIISINNKNYSILFNSKEGLVLEGEEFDYQRNKLLSFEIGDQHLEIEGKLMLSIDNIFGFRLNGEKWNQISYQLDRLGYGSLKE